MLSLVRMYRCDKCDALVPAGSPAMREVVETRPKKYTKTFTERGRERTVVIGKGHETVSELKLCHKCAGVEPPKKVRVFDDPSIAQAEPEGTLSLKLANGKEVTSNSGFELACFLVSNGSSITPLPKKKKGGKSKGARNKTKPKAKRTRDAR